jgi:hypothetical protein
LQKTSRNIVFFSIATVCFFTTYLWILESFNGEPPAPAFLKGMDDSAASRWLKSATPEQIKELEVFGLEILKTRPLDIRGITYIVLSRSAQGDEISSRNLINVGAELSFRNVQIQVPAIALKLEKKNYRKALLHADGLLRARPKTLSVVAQLLRGHRGSKQFVTELASVLADAPPWRQDFLELELNQSGGTAYVSLLFRELQKLQNVVSEKELRLLIQRMIAQSDYEGAYFVWLDFLPPDKLAAVSALFDGQFNFEPKNLYFDWTISSTANTEVAVVNSNEQRNNRYLLIDAVRETQPFTGVLQYLKMGPGKYSFSYKSSSSTFNTSGGLAWKIYCLENPSLVAQGPAHKNSESWTNYIVKFEIPQDGCATQTLYLESVGKTPLDFNMTGNVKFDDLKIRLDVQ